MLRASVTTEASWLFPKKTTGPLSLSTTGSVPQKCVSLPVLPAALICAHPEPWKLPALGHRKHGAKAAWHKEQCHPCFLTSLSCQEPSGEKYILIWQTTEVDNTLCKDSCCYQGFSSLMQLKSTWKKEESIVRGTMFRNTWFVAIRTPLWESVCSLTQHTASASIYFGFNTFQHTRWHCKMHLQSIYPLWSFRGKSSCNMILIYL